MGRDLAGVVVAVGKAVHNVRPGDRVWSPSTNYVSDFVSGPPLSPLLTDKWL
jgi:NADPH:quinone reductase-like Zn-dependent oxidoreductase